MDREADRMDGPNVCSRVTMHERLVLTAINRLYILSPSFDKSRGELVLMFELGVVQPGGGILFAPAQAPTPNCNEALISLWVSSPLDSLHSFTHTRLELPRLSQSPLCSGPARSSVPLHRQASSVDCLLAHYMSCI